MTDRFEDAVRDAAKGLSSASGDLPTYHVAWNSGRRRRMVKRSALAAAGAVVVLAALTVNLGRFPGAAESEVDDVATGIERVTPVFEPTPLATTSPIGPPAATSSAVPVGSAATPAPGEPAPNAAGTSGNGPESHATTSPVTATATEPVPTASPSNPAAVRTVTPAPLEPTPQTQTSDTGPAPTADAQSAVLTPADEPAQAADTPVSPNDDEAAGKLQQPADAGSPDKPQPAFTSASAVDATILGAAARGVAIPCDTDQDGLADATCELLVFDYPCTGGSDVRPGYTAMDLDGDERVDTCAVMDVTLCDTASDGRGDTPCIIKLIPATESNDTPGQEPNEQSGDDE